jgi:hypothetical protein
LRFSWNFLRVLAVLRASSSHADFALDAFCVHSAAGHRPRESSDRFQPDRTLMTSRSPTVSVLMTAYNRERYVAQAIESVLRSTFEDFELVLVDDHSDDGTVSIAQEFSSRDSRIRVYVNESNLGDYPNRNRAATYATGSYLKFVDSDDVIYPHGLDVMVRCIDAFPDAGLALSAVLDADVPYPQYLTPEAAYRQHFFGPGILGRAPGSAIIRRNAFEQVGGFTGRRQVGDHELWLTIARSFGVVKMPADLIWSRQHQEQEKAYDSEVDKTVMHEEVLLAALLAEDCPLREPERAAALENIVQTRVRNYWQFMTHAGGLRAAQAYRRRVGLPPSALLSFIAGRLRTLGGAGLLRGAGHRTH